MSNPETPDAVNQPGIRSALRLMINEITRRPFIKHKKTFFASAALGITGLVTTAAEARQLLDYQGTPALVQEFGNTWYHNLALEERQILRVTPPDTGCIYHFQIIPCASPLEGRTARELIDEKEKYIDRYGDNAFSRNSRGFATVFTLPLAFTAAVYGTTFAFFRGLMDEKRLRNENS